MDEIINEDRRVYFHAYRDLDFAYGYEDKARFRANYLYKTTGPGAVFRTIPSEILTADQLRAAKGGDRPRGEALRSGVGDGAYG